ncbi:MAG: hypothetical protein CMJ51_06220 [Planctomycetaceae bacterium]|nr:hypothetical protein [Planctomycetaceae bacterium]
MPDEAIECATMMIDRLRLRVVRSLVPGTLVATVSVGSSVSGSILATSSFGGIDLDGIHLPVGPGSVVNHPDLDILDLVKKPQTTPPVIDGFGRIEAPTDAEDGDLGIGGLEMAWNPEDLFSVAVVIGGRMGAIDRGWTGPEFAQIDAPLDDPVTGLTGAPTAFNGLGFGGVFGGEINPFESNRVFMPSRAEDDLGAAFVATRAKFRPSKETSFGFVATRGGASDADTSLLGFDFSQKIGGHQVEAWMQQTLGSSERMDVESDSSAIGASLGGDLLGLRYTVGWRRIGDGFESGLGTSGVRGSHAMIGRLEGGLPIDAVPFFQRWEFAIKARMDTDLELDPNAIDLDIDAIRLVTETGERIEFGLRQSKRITRLEFPDSGGDSEIGSETRTETEIETHDRYRVGISSDPGRPIRWQGQVDFGDAEASTLATWQGGARWSPGGGVQIGGTLAADRSLDDRRLNETLRAAVDGGFGVGRMATVRSRFGYDASTSRITLGHAIGWTLDHQASISVSVEQDLPVIALEGRSSVLRARLSGRFEF